MVCCFGSRPFGWDTILGIAHVYNVSWPHVWFFALRVCVGRARKGTSFPPSTGGDPFPLKCLATVTPDPSSSSSEQHQGEFLWVVGGDRILPSQSSSSEEEEVESLGGGAFRQEFFYSPSIEHDGKTLACK